MNQPTPDAISTASQCIAPLARRTPLEAAPMLREPAADVWLKMEIWQRTGSFKVRGAR